MSDKTKIKISVRIDTKTLDRLKKDSESKGVTVSDNVRQIVDNYYNMSDNLQMSDKNNINNVRQIEKRPTNKGKLSDNVSTKKEAPKIENKTQNKIDVSQLSFAQIMNLKRNNKT